LVHSDQTLWNMKIRSNIQLAFIAIAAFTFVQCSDAGHADSMADDLDRSMADVNNPGPETRTSPNDAAITMQPQSVEAQLNAADPTAGYTYPDGRKLSPAEERQRALVDMRGLRTRLVADLEAVRERLNDGSRSEASKGSDNAMAADLAQGLERVDRALETMNASTDMTWNEMRASRLTEVAEVREWLLQYHKGDMEAMK
jgi:hypothetical protein